MARKAGALECVHVAFSCEKYAFVCESFAYLRLSGKKISSSYTQNLAECISPTRAGFDII